MNDCQLNHNHTSQPVYLKRSTKFDLDFGNSNAKIPFCHKKKVFLKIDLFVIIPVYKIPRIEV